jgi:thiamine biosynthesis lipoprotein
MKKDTLSKMGRSVDRRTFLKAAGALGVGAVAGGLLQSKFDVAGIGRGLKKVSQTHVAMGTWVTVTAVHDSSDLAEQSIGAVFEEMDRSIAVFNRFDSASPVSVLNRDGVVSGAPGELTTLLEWARHFNQVSGGSFDVTVKPLVDLLKQTAGAGVKPSGNQVDETLALVDAEGIEIGGGKIRFRKQGMGVTLDGIAKGHIVDSMSARLSELGVTNHLINAGGDIRAAGFSRSGDPWTIAVEDPEKKHNYPDVIRLSDGAVATSGNYEIYYGREKLYHHVVDPFTGLCPQLCASVTVRARSTMVADALSTAVFVMEPTEGLAVLETLRDRYAAEVFVLDADGKQFSTTGWKSV